MPKCVPEVTPRGRVDAALALSALAAIGGVAAALVSQHVYDLRPCPWCVLQRLIFLALAGAALLALAWRSPMGCRAGIGLAALMSLAGFSAALWQHFVAAASASCNMTFADRVIGATGLDRALPQVFAAYASCAEAQAKLLGVPYEFWSAALFAGLGVGMLVVWLTMARE